MVDRYDVIVVGGRVAGSTLASLLGAGGFEVLLLERATFPSDALSTHVIYGDSFGVWERIGAWPSIAQLRSARLVGISWIRDGQANDIRGRFWPVRGHDYSLCLRRVLLDDILFRTAAETPGVTAVPGTRVTELLREGDRVTGVRFEGQGRPPGSAASTATARLVAGCDGRRSLVARTVGAATYIEEPPINFAFYTYIEDVGAGPDPEPMFEIWESERTGGTLMLAPCDAGISMTIVYLPQEGFDAFRSDKDGNFWKVMDCDPRVGPRLRAGTQVTPIRGAGDLSNFIRQPVGEGWALVGDAGQHKDPIFGQGIGDAVRSAEALADRLLEAESAGSDWGTALARYHVDRDLDLVPTFRWMIQGRAGGLSAQEFRSVLERTGSDPERSERFINIFSHAVSSSEYFGRLNTTELLGRDPASYNTRWSGSAPTGEVGG